MSTPAQPESGFKRPSDVLVGSILVGKYKILSKIGEGGMGSVYRAIQAPIDRQVAIKVLLGKLAEDEVAVKRFEQEAKAVSKMQHPNTVTIYDYGQTEDNRLYIVMEFLKGRALSDVLRSKGAIEPARAIHIIKQVCASLGDAHAAGIIHRDLKPDNIFLTEVGGDKDWVKVLDFGVAKLADNEQAATLTQTGMIFGTPKYMSPEQAEGKPIDHRADLYAIGVVLYELLTGRPPFLADTPIGLLLKHIQEPPPPFKKLRPDLDIPPELEAVTMKALEKLPDRRFEKVADLAQELDNCLRSMTTGVSPVVRPPTLVPPPGSRSGLPTEVVPGKQGTPDMSPGDLQAPTRVPSNLSLGVGTEAQAPISPRTERAAPVEAATQRAASVGQAPQPSALQQDLSISSFTSEPGAIPGNTTPGGITRPVPQQGPGVETLGGVLFEGQRPQKQNRTGLMIGGAALVLGAAGIFAFLVLGNPAPKPQPSPMQAPPVAAADPKPAVANPSPMAPPAPTPVAPTPVAPPPAPAPELRADGRRPVAPKRPVEQPAETNTTINMVIFTFESTPAGAKVIDDQSGATIGSTPLSRAFAHSDQVKSFTFKLDGYEPLTQKTKLDKDSTVNASLKALPAAAPAPVPAAVEAAPKAPTPAARPEKKPEEKKPEEKTIEKIDDLRGF